MEISNDDFPSLTWHFMTLYSIINTFRFVIISLLTFPHNSEMSRTVALTFMSYVGLRIRMFECRVGGSKFFMGGHD